MDRNEAIESMHAEGKGKAPYVSQETAEAKIVAEHYWLVPGTLTTVCCLVLENGFTVVAEAAAASPENFIPATGEARARTKAKEKIFAHMAYVICEDRHRADSDAFGRAD